MVTVVQYTFIHKKYTEQHNETEYPERNIYESNNTYGILVHKIKQKNTKYTTVYTMIQNSTKRI
jgi:hypothetical protein